MSRIILTAPEQSECDVRFNLTFVFAKTGKSEIAKMENSKFSRQKVSKGNISQVIDQQISVGNTGYQYTINNFIKKNFFAILSLKER